MADILPFKKHKVEKKPAGNTLCRNGHHKWEIWKARQFDVKEGRLVTVYRCTRCNAQRVKTQ